MRKQLLSTLFIATLNFCLGTLDTFSQCITNVNFNTWSQAGIVANGNWAVQNAGSQIYQSINGDPTFFISPFQMMNVKISGNFRTTNTDDDFMGFVFSFLDPLGPSNNYNGWLFDWKQNQQIIGLDTAKRGKALSRMNGIIPIVPSIYSHPFWNHRTILPQFELKQNDFGGPGWVTNFNHAFVLELTFTRAKIYIDGALIFDQQDCFLPGYFGFYNYSQPDCYYSNFQYELYVDFTVLTTPVCVGDTANFQFLDTACLGSIVNLNQYQSLTWNWGDGTVDINNNPTVNNVNPSHTYTTTGTYTVTLYLQDTQGCTDTATHTITINPKPIPIITGTNAICNGQSAILTASGGGTYSWNTGVTTSSITITPTINTNYTITVTNASGCTSTATQTVTVNPTPIATAGNNQTICAGLTVVLNAGGGNTYSWSPSTGLNNTTLANPTVTASVTATYTVTVSNVNGCTDVAWVTVTVNPLPTAIATASSAIITIGNSATLTTTGGITYGWAPATGLSCDTCSTTIATPNSTTPYCVTVTDANNCTDTACVTVTVEPIDCSNAGKLFLPNAFSPNNDGENDVLQVYYGNYLCIKTLHLIIYDRWGEKVFSTNDPSAEWDGSFRGKVENTAVFVYSLQATMTDGKEIARKGNVSLVR